GAALTSARDVARKDSQPSRKRFLLISDGEDHGRELNLALEAIRAETYRVDCIGIGSDQAVPIPLALAREPPLVAQPFLPRQARDALSAPTGRAASEPREPQGAIEYLLDDAGRRVTTKFD